jgi:hypothetical protein
MKQQILLIALTIFTLQSCDFKMSKTWKNDNIDYTKREQIRVLNDKLFEALTNNDVAGVRALMSDTLVEKVGSGLDKLISQVSSSFQSGSYTILDEYNIHNSTIGAENTLSSGDSDDNAYIITYGALNKEMYVSLLLPTGLNDEPLVTVVYGNYDNQWKINILQFGQYSLFKKTAPDYYKLAKESYEKSYLIDAVSYMELAKRCLRPAANDLFQYKKEKEIQEFYDKIMREANAKFVLPLTLDNIDTKPQIIEVYPEIIDEGPFPMISYLSGINIKDTVALKNEYEKIKIEVNQLFTGINKDKKYVFYRAFNEIPDGTKTVKRYGFVDQLTE